MFTLPLRVRSSLRCNKALSGPRILQQTLQSPVLVSSRRAKPKTLAQRFAKRTHAWKTLINTRNIQTRLFCSLSITEHQELEPAEDVVNKAVALWADCHSESAINLLQDFMNQPPNPDYPPHFHVLQNASVLIQLGTILMSQGRLEEAEQNYQILVNASLLQLDRWSNSLKETDKIMKSVGKSSDEWLTQKEREDNLHEAIQDLTQTLATIYHDLGRTQESLNKTLESQSSYNMALELLERIASTDTELLSTIRTNLSMLYENLGNYKVAGPHHEQVLRQTTETERYDHPHMMTSLHPCHLVSTDFSEQKKREDALDQSSPGWREQEMQWDPNDQRTNDEKAGELTQRILTERLLKNPSYVAYKQEKGEPLPVLPSQSNYTSTAPSLLPSASGIASLSESPVDGTEPNALIDMSQTASQFASLFPSGENEDGYGGLLAEMTAEKGIDMIQAQTRKELSTVDHMLDGHIANLGESHMALVPIYSHLAVLSRRAGEFGPSLEYLNRALSIVKLHKGVRHCAYATMLMHIAIHHHAAQDLILAEVNAKQALHLKEELLGSDHLHVGLIHYDLAIILGKRSLFKESLQAIKEAVAIFTKKLYIDHSITQIAKMTLSRGESLIREQSIEDSHKALKGFKPE